MCDYETVPTENGSVRQHRSQSPAERQENREIAVYLANKYGYDIDLLPKVDDEPGRKNVDSFNRTLGYPQEYKVNRTPSYNAIDMALRSARRQADSIVIRLDTDIRMDVVADAMNNRIHRYANVTEVVLLKNGKDVWLTREQILSEGFTLVWEDFK